MFNLYIKQAAEIFGVTHTREIYEKAIEVLPDEQAREMCIRFADLERKLGEIDRARAIYMHSSQMADPRTTPTFWKVWHDFEVRHGNEDTFREMLRIKRSVQAQFNTQVNFMSAQMLAAAASKSAGAGTEEAVSDDMQLLEQQAQAVAAAKAKTDVAAKLKEKVLFVRAETSQGDNENNEPVANPEEIDIDDDDDDDDEDENRDEEEVQVEQQLVPSKVFGGLKHDDD